jgi:hypothetical protein
VLVPGLGLGVGWWVRGRRLRRRRARWWGARRGRGCVLPPDAGEMGAGGVDGLGWLFRGRGAGAGLRLRYLRQQLEFWNWGGHAGAVRLVFLVWVPQEAAVHAALKGEVPAV